MQLQPKYVYTYIQLHENSSIAFNYLQHDGCSTDNGDSKLEATTKNQDVALFNIN